MIRKIMLVCLLMFLLTGATFDAEAQRVDFINGADGSIIDQIEQSGGKFYDDGTEKEVLEIFKKYGFNLIRLKLWHTPAQPYNGLPNVLEMAKRIDGMGMDFMLDFHYSDTWADPGHQYKPAAWEDLSFEILGDSVYEYTKYVMTLLKEQNTLPTMVQIGNEIACGMLWDDGRICGEFNNQWDNLGILIKKGIEGVNASLTEKDDVKIIIHFDNGANNTGCQWFYTNIINQGIDFDIIGLSYYPWWHGTLVELENNLNDLATRYNKDIILVEGAYPWTLAWSDNTGNIIGSADQLHEGYPASVEGQKEFLTDVLDILKRVDNNKGKGFVYWSPEWIPGYPGSPWENLALFDFEGEALESIKVFQNESGIDNGLIFKPFTLSNPYPVPASAKITIEFSMNSNKSVELLIYDASGRLVDSLINEVLDEGQYSINWNAEQYRNGIYYVVFKSEGFNQVKKLVVQ